MRVVTFVILMVIKHVFRMKLRLPDEVLEIGDVAVHGEEAYPSDELVGVGALPGRRGVTDAARRQGAREDGQVAGRRRLAADPPVGRLPDPRPGPPVPEPPGVSARGRPPPATRSRAPT